MDYPTELPLVEVKSLIMMIKNQEIVTKRSQFAHALWVVQGFAQNKLLGSGSEFDLVSQAAPEACCGGGCNAAASLQDAALSQLEKAAAAAEGVAPQALIDWKVILKFAVEKLLEYLLSQAL